MQNPLTRAVATAPVAWTGGADASTVTFDSIGDSARFSYITTLAGANLNGAVSYTLSQFGSPGQRLMRRR
jgi:hypothetical protein